MSKRFDEVQARANFIKFYQLEGKVTFDGRYFTAIKSGDRNMLVTETLLQSTVIVIYEAWMNSARFHLSIEGA